MSFPKRGAHWVHKNEELIIKKSKINDFQDKGSNTPSKGAEAKGEHYTRTHSDFLYPLPKRCKTLHMMTQKKHADEMIHVSIDKSLFHYDDKADSPIQMSKALINEFLRGEQLDIPIVHTFMRLLSFNFLFL